MKKQILLIHGGDVFETREEYLAHLKSLVLDFGKLLKLGWKDTLGEKLGEDFQVIAPQMPNKNNARYAEWQIWLEKVLPLLDQEIILIGHSLGGLFLAKYLAENKLTQKVRALFLISAPYGLSEKINFLADFTLPDSFELISQQTNKIFLYHSQDDPVVPFTDAERYAQSLPGATPRFLPDRGHFSVLEIPELVADIKSLV